LAEVSVWMRAPADFEALLGKAGFGAMRHWTDDQGWFAVFLAAG